MQSNFTTLKYSFARSKLFLACCFPQQTIRHFSDIWTELTYLTSLYKAVHLGEGIVDYGIPSFLRKEISQVARLSKNIVHQETPDPAGYIPLRKILAKLYNEKLSPSRKVDPIRNISISHGATMALFSSIHTLCTKDATPVVIEPYFYSFAPYIRHAGGKPNFVPLRQLDSKDPSNWLLDFDELESKLSANTRFIILNTPHNPTGKVFSYNELSQIAKLCQKYDLYCISDEVYEWFVYPPNKHIRISTLPGMWERTVTIGSVGKAFGLTGWRIGWYIGPENLLTPIRRTHAFVHDRVATPLQEVVANAFKLEFSRFNTASSFIHETCGQYQIKRDLLIEALKDGGFNPLTPDAGWFILADWTKIAKESVDFNEYLKRLTIEEPVNFSFVKWLIAERKLSSMPLTLFYGSDNIHIGEKFIRFCFCRKDSTIAAASDILKEGIIRKPNKSDMNVE